MKKRGPPLRDIKNHHALIGIWRACEGQPNWLANSLRRGRASTAEQRVAADLIEGKVRPRRPRSVDSWQEHRLQIVQDYVSLKKLRSYLPKRQRQEKDLKQEVANRYRVSTRYVENVLAEFDEKALSEIERIFHAKSPLHGLDRDTLELVCERLRKESSVWKLVIERFRKELFARK